MARRTSLAAALAVLFAVAGCASTSSGQGAPAGSGTPLITVAPDTDSTSPATPTSSPAMTGNGQTGGGNTGGGRNGGSGQTGGGGGPTGRPSTGTATHSPSTDPNAQAELLVFETVAGPSCTGTSGTSTVTLAWQTRAATEVWIQVIPVAVAASDPKTTPGSSGPLPANGRKTLPFDCSGQYDYYNIGVYNTGNGTHTGETKQVVRNL